MFEQRGASEREKQLQQEFRHPSGSGKEPERRNLEQNVPGSAQAHSCEHRAEDTQLGGGTTRGGHTTGGGGAQLGGGHNWGGRTTREGTHNWGGHTTGGGTTKGGAHN